MGKEWAKHIDAEEKIKLISNSTDVNIKYSGAYENVSATMQAEQGLKQIFLLSNNFLEYLLPCNSNTIPNHNGFNPHSEIQ